MSSYAQYAMSPSVVQPIPRMNTPGMIDFTDQERLEFSKILSSLTISEESISSARKWVVQHEFNNSSIIAIMIRDAILNSTSFKQRLNYIYLMNDIVYASIRHNTVQNPTGFIQLFKPHLACIFQNTYNCSFSKEERSKIDTIISLWREKHIYDTVFMSNLIVSMHASTIPPLPPAPLLQKPGAPQIYPMPYPVTQQMQIPPFFPPNMNGYPMVQPPSMMVPPFIPPSVPQVPPINSFSGGLLADALRYEQNNKQQNKHYKPVLCEDIDKYSQDISDHELHELFLKHMNEIDDLFQQDST